MNGFERRAFQIKGNIIQTTLEMLKTWDSSKIRIADIAKTANVSQVTIYNYFGNKEALLREAVKKYIEDSFNDFLENMNGDYTFKEKIESIILQERESSLSSLTPFFMRLVKEDQEIAQFMEKEYNERILPAFLQLIEEGRKNGKISDKISNEGLFVFINFSMKYTNELYDSIQQTGNMNLMNEMLHIFLYGICGKE
ncbi:TetR/AcrR family transcriptional regulator [Neobacillus sp. SM06]|uniref:TetR/AcrR family transcriptional regulator n=1 Tax=Neobacillus sp. SM06 TaxID=3422492 RepID=UPI003D28A856